MLCFVEKMEQVRVALEVIVLYIWWPLLSRQKSGHCLHHRQTVAQHSELVETMDLEPNLLTAFTCQYVFMGTRPSRSLARGVWPQQQKWVAVTETTWPVKPKGFGVCPFTEEACLFLVVSVDRRDPGLAMGKGASRKQHLFSHEDINTNPDASGGELAGSWDVRKYYTDTLLGHSHRRP